MARKEMEDGAKDLSRGSWIQCPSRSLSRFPIPVGELYPCSPSRGSPPGPLAAWSLQNGRLGGCQSQVSFRPVTPRRCRQGLEMPCRVMVAQAPKRRDRRFPLLRRSCRTGRVRVSDARLRMMGPLSFSGWNRMACRNLSATKPLKLEKSRSRSFMSVGTRVSLYGRAEHAGSH